MIPYIIALMGLSFLLGYFFSKKPDNEKTLLLLQGLSNQLKELIMKTSEIKAFVEGIQSQVEKAKVEITNKIAALEEAINNGGEVPQEVVDALDALKTSVQGVDDIVPDETPAP